jgi:hypothetical protein
MRNIDPRFHGDGLRSPDGEIGIHAAFRAQFRYRSCEFESRSGHMKKNKMKAYNDTYFKEEMDSAGRCR